MDLRYARRTLFNSPGFTALAVATLALGIGINTVVFTVYGSVAFRQLPVHAPEEMVRFRWSAALGVCRNEMDPLAATTTGRAGVLNFITESTLQ
jgi:hypothetical protein